MNIIQQNRFTIGCSVVRYPSPYISGDTESYKKRVWKRRIQEAPMRERFAQERQLRKG